MQKKAVRKRNYAPPQLGQKEILVFSPTRLRENAFLKARKVFYSKYICHICTLYSILYNIPTTTPATSFHTNLPV